MGKKEPNNNTAKKEHSAVKKSSRWDNELPAKREELVRMRVWVAHATAKLWKQQNGDDGTTNEKSSQSASQPVLVH